MTTPPAPARLFVLLARNAPVGVILRRGPSNWVQMIHWDTANDKFTPGQWFHGRIYEHRCDLSPSGRYFVYCAYKPGNRPADPSYGERWTAISRPPYFTALALWPLKSNIGGGGFFIENKKMVLNHLNDNVEPHPKHKPHNLQIVLVDENTFLRNSIFFHRLLRDGFNAVLRDRWGRKDRWDRWAARRFKWNAMRLPFWYRGPFIAENEANIRLEKRNLVCRIVYRYRAVEKRNPKRRALYEIVPEYRYSVYSPETKLASVNWADYDQKNRLVFVKDGKLFADPLRWIELADFNANQPEAVPPIAWAKKW